MHIISVCSVPSSRHGELCFDCDEESGCETLLCSFPVGPDELLCPVCPDEPLPPVGPDEPCPPV